jgi:(S)-3,5-dihydroxyphenylglycine transaminase
MLLSQPARLSAPHLDVMNFLNEIVLRYPSAISFAPGRPADHYCDITPGLIALQQYITTYEKAQKHPATAIRRQIGQYSKTNGIINDIICCYLANDEAIYVPEEAIMVTNGAQEGMAILVAGLFDPQQDVLLIADPTYNGMTGIASILGIEQYPVPTNEEGMDFAMLHQALEQIRDQGKKPRALYLVPDFSNPTGTTMPLQVRQQLLELAREQEMLIIEDNPYGMLAYDIEPLPTLKALDHHGVVIYLGTFAKLLIPGIRVGFMVADQHVAATAQVSEHLLAQELSKVKSLISVNTSPLTQAIIGGMLLEQQCSLKTFIQERIAFYRCNRDQMLQSLEKHFKADPLLTDIVSWNHPHGGFFLTMTLPFAMTPELLQQCAEIYGVICCPMLYFSFLPGHALEIRLSFSAVSPDAIEQGIQRLWQFVRAHIDAPHLSLTS